MQLNLLSRCVRLTALTTAAWAALSGPVSAEDRSWSYVIGCGSADFTSTSCWRAGLPDEKNETAVPPPAAGDNVFLVRGIGGLNNVFATSGTTPMPTYGSLTIRGSVGAIGLLVERNHLRVSGDTELGWAGGGHWGAPISSGRIIQTGGTTGFNRLALHSNSEYLLTGGSMTVNRLDVASAYGSGSLSLFQDEAQIRVQGAATMMVNGPAEFGMFSRPTAALLVSQGGRAVVHGPLAMYGRASVETGSSLEVGGSTTLGATKRASPSLLLNGGSQFVGDHVHALAASTVDLAGGARMRGRSDATDLHRFDNDGRVQFSGTGATLAHTFNNQGAVFVRTGARAVFETGYAGTGSLDIAAGGVAVFGASGKGTTLRQVGLTGAGRSEYASTVVLSLSGGNLHDAGDFKLLDSANLVAPVGAGQLIVDGELGFAGQLSVTFAQGTMTPLAGSRYDLFDWGSSQGTFATLNFSGAPLTPGLFWDTSELYTQGVLKVSAVPEPGTWALGLAGLAFIGSLTRQRRAGR